MLDSSENLFYSSKYLEIQAHEEVRDFEDDRFQIFFSINEGVATSLPQSLFGSFECQSETTQAAFLVFVKATIDKLKGEAIHRIEVIHPPAFYAGFVPATWLDGAGFSEMYADINHHIVLTEFQMHRMEKRKLAKLNRSGLIIRKLLSDHLREVYDFLDRCRKEKGLELNISFEKLTLLFQAFPDRYSIFCAYLADQLVSATITVQTTLEKNKKESPMVGLMNYLVSHYKDKAKYIDLGISSRKGEPQEGLIAFKQRIGGMKSLKPTYEIIL